MVLDWYAYHAQVKQMIADIGRASPDIVRGYRQLGAAGAATAQLDAKTRELIAVAVAVTVQCDGCIVVHTDAALKNGATEAEIIEALGVAVSVKAGSALIYGGRALDVARAKMSAEDREP